MSITPDDPRRSPEPREVERWEMMPKFTVADLIDWCAQRNLDPTQVNLTGGGHMKWKTRETEAERDRRLTIVNASDERHEKWQREMWEQLRPKYEAPSTQPTEETT